MGRDQLRFGKVIVAISFAVAVFTLVQASSARSAVIDSYGQGDEWELNRNQDEDLCRLNVAILGQGTVNSQVSVDKSKLLSAESNEVRADCDEIVRLTAVPDPFHRFESWQGVAEERQFDLNIEVKSSANVTAIFTPRQILEYKTLSTPFVDRGGQLVTELPIFESVWQSPAAIDQEAASPPSIVLWYGNSQSFGHIGTPQEWLNILGNVSDPDGDLQKLEYSLNGSPTRELSFGGDGTMSDLRRNYRQGDFNVDINIADVYLNEGSNTVEITATDSLTEATTSVNFQYDSTKIWPGEYKIDWSNVSALQDAVQIVDGYWDYSPAGVYPLENGYDRILALGDITWTDFELTVPVTVNGYSLEGFGPIQSRPAMGLVMRWQGHTDEPISCDQPLCGYYPIGATAWYEFPDKTSEEGQFSIWSKTFDKTYDQTDFSLTWEETYYWKVRSQSIDGTTGRYSMKIWPAGGDEPEDWLITKDGRSDSHLSGSVLLLSHHVDVIFGDVSIIPLIPGEGAPEVYNLRKIPEPFGATIQWSTTEPAKSQLDYGTTNSYGNTLTSEEYVTDHSYYLPDLDQEKDYHFQITVTDNENESRTTPDDVFTTQQLISLLSDDFNTCNLGSDWVFIDPLEDSGYELNGNQALIEVPAGENHDIYPSPGLPTNRAPRLMRAVTDPDNLMVKFDSGLLAETAIQGIVVEQDSANFLRINYQNKGGQLEFRVMGFKTGSTPVTISKANLPDAAKDGPFYLLLNRLNGKWQVSYSTDGDTWMAVGPFSFPLRVTQVGVFAGNHHQTPGNEPAFTALVDYFFDASAPIEPEDGDALNLPVSITGNGSVSKEPSCGNPVTLTAAAASGWHFEEWQGSSIDGRIDLEISTPFQVGDEVTAVFAPGEPQEYAIQSEVEGEGSINFDPDKETFIRGEKVELTAEPAAGWQFDGWSGDLSGNDPVQSILMDGNKNVKANFSRAELSLDITIIGPGQVQRIPQGPYDYDEEVTLLATPNVNSLASFIGWSGDVESTENPLKVTMTEDLAVTATFVNYKQFMPVTLSPNGS